jgi:hypothetical protein
VVGFAVDPTNVSRYYVAVASGGVWKTVNAGITWTPVFDNEGSYSIGAITLDPKNPLTVWVGTGENNSQRSVSYGNGVYKSEDGGRTWRNVGGIDCKPDDAPGSKSWANRAQTESVERWRRKRIARRW